MLKMLLPMAALAASIACAPAATAPASAPMVGVLEERLGASTEESARFVVRAVFHKEDDAWRAYPVQRTDTSAIPAETAWTISLNGERLGDVSARTPAQWALLADVGRQELADTAAAPTSGERSTEFSGWQDAPIYRPLIATSPAAFANPQPWTATPAPADTQAALRQSFRMQFADVVNCADAESAAAPRAYADGDIEIGRTYASSSGWRVATLRLGGYGCDGPIEGAYAVQTYAISPMGEVRHLGEGLLLLDSGDYDGDGQSEAIFAIDRYNQGGYQLFTSDFGQNAAFEFSYH